MSSDSAPSRWGFLSRRKKSASGEVSDKTHLGPSTWSMGVLNDKQTVEVPGSVLLLAANRNEPLGLRNMNARTSHSSIPAGFHVDMPMTPGGTRPLPMTPGGTRPMPTTPSGHSHHEVEVEDDKKRTEDGAIILDPQPEESANDPLNWPSWRRDSALLSLGFYCMLGGGMTPLIAAGFTDVAHDLHVEVETVALTTGLYMMGLGLGSVIASPTAILYGKRPVYIASSILFIATCVWAGYSPNFPSLVAARVFQGMAISPVECLPSATIAEIFFLHERAYRIGIYTLLLLGGKNLVPLVSAAIIGRFGWRWTFWIVSMIVALSGILLFFFVPETFWDRTPTRSSSDRPNFFRRISARYSRRVSVHTPVTPMPHQASDGPRPQSPGAVDRNPQAHVGFAPASVRSSVDHATGTPSSPHHHKHLHVGFADASNLEKQTGVDSSMPSQLTPPAEEETDIQRPQSVHSHSSFHASRPAPHPNSDTLKVESSQDEGTSSSSGDYFSKHTEIGGECIPHSRFKSQPKIQAYTHNLRQLPAQSFIQQLKPYHGRLNADKWHKVMVRPFILLAYPAVLWSSITYACSIGWLIVISETMALIYRNPEGYNFDALQTGLVYLSPFIGGILGTGVAGKISDIIVKAMSRRNGGLYEPEFRLVMAIPVLFTTCIGLMGFGWSAEQNDHWIVPTVFFGVVSFGCSLGSTTAITFCVDSYRQYAGEALVTLNFTKNIMHGLVFSLFITHWLVGDGPKMVYIWIGIIQLILLLTTIPLYIYGKRLRMWTVRKNFMEKF
ncbi:hypothetical protein VHEMI06945 [[Torrubiella] hemipterigena]|uniref:Major facilitator superfamily (MFS) profile domain-containing protein n=1 Tax=[Torrubiella] hemipterigena TaxID=1531966 RepID=A0A0A1TKR8_9HYPO|nr:hypothetical protein VHEMI06945 [[Torrubiella] hemipterigena]